MSHVFPRAEAAVRLGQIDWESDDIRLLLVMADSTAGDPDERDAEFLSDFAVLDECDAAGYARTPLAGRRVDFDSLAGVVSMHADETATPAIGAGSRPNLGAIVYAHVGADSVNRPLLWLDPFPWFPFLGSGSPARFRWGVDGIYRVIDLT